MKLSLEVVVPDVVVPDVVVPDVVVPKKSTSSFPRIPSGNQTWHWKTPCKWRLTAGKINYKWEIFCCHV